MARILPLEIAIAALVIGLDQITKAIVRSRMELYETIPVIPGFFDLTRVHNTGAAFGLLDGAEFPFKTLVMSFVAAAALAGLTLYALTLGSEHRLTRLGLASVVGGAAGNLIDRLRAGYVLDFFDFYVRGWHFWAFNIADAAITVGVVLMILDMVGIGRFRVSRAV